MCLCEGMGVLTGLTAAATSQCEPPRHTPQREAHTALPVGCTSAKLEGEGGPRTAVVSHSTCLSLCYFIKPVLRGSLSRLYKWGPARSKCFRKVAFFNHHFRNDAFSQCAWQELSVNLCFKVLSNFTKKKPPKTEACPASWMSGFPWHSGLAHPLHFSRSLELSLAH